jgi:hypothetical protein
MTIMSESVGKRDFIPFFEGEVREKWGQPLK